MLIEKLMMPYVLASQHYMVNISFFIAMLWVYTHNHAEQCFTITIDCALINEPDYVEGLEALNIAFQMSMWGNLICFVLHYTIQRLQLSSNIEDDEKGNVASKFNQFAFLRKYLMLIKVMVQFAITTNA